MSKGGAGVEALYIHIPFCSKICTYCDFYKMMAKTSVKEKYVAYLVKELEMRKELLSDVKTVYIGGGTPSSLPLHLLDYLLHHISRLINVHQLTEFTMEMNPKDVTKSLVQLVKQYNVNRVSLGVQSFDAKKLEFLGRDHSKREAIRSVRTLQRNGIKNINVDIIYATPNDSFRKVKKDIMRAVDLNVKHISTYSLILEQNTVLFHQYQKKQFTLLDQDKEYQIYNRIRHLLLKFGYQHYEISNFSKRHHQSQHNLIYWTNKKYLGIGAGASYYIDDIRYTNVMHLETYFGGIDRNELVHSEKTQLSNMEQMQEEMILGLRKINGVNLNEFEQKFGKPLFDVFPNLKSMLKKKMLKVSRKRCIYIPKRKLYLSNVVLVEFI